MLLHRIPRLLLFVGCIAAPWTPPATAQDDPDSLTNWICEHLKDTSPGYVDALIRRADDLPNEWSPQSRDEMRCRIFGELARIADPKALDLLHRWRDHKPEVGRAVMHDLCRGTPHEYSYTFTPLIDYAIERIAFMEAFRGAKTDAERVHVCCEDMFQHPCGSTINDPVGAALISKGGAKYVPFLQDEISQRDGEQGWVLVYELGELQRGGGLDNLEAYFLHLASTRDDRAGQYALDVLQRQGTPASLDGLEALARAGGSSAKWARRAADFIRWRDILARSGGAPSDAELRWAIDIMDLSQEAYLLAQPRGYAMVKKLIADLPAMGVSGQSATLRLLGDVLEKHPEPEAFAMTRELSERRDLMFGVPHDAINLLARYGGPHEYEYLAGREQEALAAQKLQGAQPWDPYEVDVLRDAIRWYKFRQSHPK